MGLPAMGSSASSPAALETSWQRSERECAARRRGDVYYELNEQRTPVSPSDATAAANLEAGFTLHL